jgi:hypothetical protein
MQRKRKRSGEQARDADGSSSGWRTQEGEKERHEAEAIAEGSTATEAQQTAGWRLVTLHAMSSEPTLPIRASSCTIPLMYYPRDADDDSSSGWRTKKGEEERHEAEATTEGSTATEAQQQQGGD